jgi:hypothetical protein
LSRSRDEVCFVVTTQPGFGVTFDGMDRGDTSMWIVITVSLVLVILGAR